VPQGAGHVLEYRRNRDRTGADTGQVPTRTSGIRHRGAGGGAAVGVGYQPGHVVVMSAVVGGVSAKCQWRELLVSANHDAKWIGVMVIELRAALLTVTARALNRGP